MTYTVFYPLALASDLALRAGEKYRPSNGTEGDLFFSDWCHQCQRDKSMREGAPIEQCDDDEVCTIIGNTFAYDVDDPEYPTEWQYGKDGQPCCTAFVAIGDPIPTPRDTLTIDMFEPSTTFQTDFSTTPTKGENA